MIDIFSCYYEFLSKLDSIEEYINKTYKRDNGLSDIIDNYEGDNHELLEYYKNIIGSQILYNAIVINLYGNYENFVVKICGSYLEDVFRITTSLDDLPKPIFDKYRSSVGDYLNSKHKFNSFDFNIDDIIENYNRFLKSDFSRINYDLLLQHSANLNSIQLQAFLKELGIIKENNIYHSDFLKNYYIDNQLCDETEFKKKIGRNSNDLFIYLDGLVRSRNMIAHTGEDSNRISANDFIEVTIPFLKVVARIILDNIITRIFERYSLCSKIPIISIYNNKILCINNEGKNIHNGDIVIYEHDNQRHNAIINSIEINSQPVVETGNQVVNVGLGLDNKIKENWTVVSIVDKNVKISIQDFSSNK